MHRRATPKRPEFKSQSLRSGHSKASTLTARSVAQYGIGDRDGNIVSQACCLCSLQRKIVVEVPQKDTKDPKITATKRSREDNIIWTPSLPVMFLGSWKTLMLQIRHVSSTIT